MSEILGTLFKYLLALLAITAVVVVLYEALGSNTTSSEVAGLTQMQANIYQLYEGESGSPTALPATASGLISAGVVPSSMIGTSSAGAQIIKDPWGTSATIASATSPAVAAITFPDIPVSACAKLVTSLATAGASVAGGSASAYPSDVTSGDLASKAASVCTPSSGSSTSITISFYPSTAASASAGSSSSSSSSS